MQDESAASKSAACDLLEGKLLEDIRLAANKGMALGNGRFEAEIESLTGRRMTAKKMGRPVGWRKKSEDE